MLFRQLNWVDGLKPNDDIMLYAIDCAVPGSGGGAGGPAVTEPAPPAGDVDRADCWREASLGWPTRFSVLDAALKAINCSRCFSSRATVWLVGTATTAATAPMSLPLPGRTPTRYTAPATTA